MVSRGCLHLAVPLWNSNLSAHWRVENISTAVTAVLLSGLTVTQAAISEGIQKRKIARSF